MKDAIADVAGVAVAEQHVPEGLGLGVDPPAVQPLAVVGLDHKVAVLESCRSRRADDRR